MVETPVSLRGEQKELLRQFDASLEQGSHHPKEQSFFEGVKKFFTRAVDGVAARAERASLAVFGITGRMGQSLIRALREGCAVRAARRDRLGRAATAWGWMPPPKARPPGSSSRRIRPQALQRRVGGARFQSWAARWPACARLRRSRRAPARRAPPGSTGLRRQNLRVPRRRLPC